MLPFPVILYLSLYNSLPFCYTGGLSIPHSSPSTGVCTRSSPTCSGYNFIAIPGSYRHPKFNMPQIEFCLVNPHLGKWHSIALATQAKNFRVILDFYFFAVYPSYHYILLVLPLNYIQKPTSSHCSHHKHPDAKYQYLSLGLFLSPPN